MRVGNHNIFIIVFITIFFKTILFAQEKVILENLEPTFEEDTEITPKNDIEEVSKIKSKAKKNINTKETIVNLRALDKITAKTSDINIVVGKKKKFGYLEIFPKKCSKSQDENDKGVAAYIQVKDLSDKKDDKVFVFNGWTFSSSPSISLFDHPVYDIWLIKCY